MSSTQGTADTVGNIKRFFSIFFAICTVAGIVNVVNNDGTARVVWIVVAVVCAVLTVILARSWPFLRSKEF